MKKPRNLISKFQRGFSILNHYGINANRMKRKLDLYISILVKFGCKGSFPVTIILMDRYSYIIKYLVEMKMEIEIHGYRHIDLTSLSQKDQSIFIEKAKQAYFDYGLFLLGFRCPYLRWNLDTFESLGKNGFLYSSNMTFLWNILGAKNLNERQNYSYKQVVDFYKARISDSKLSLPNFWANVLDIPVSLPDDEMLVDRLEFSNHEISQVWDSILEMSYQTGELFTLQLHPERINKCHLALERLLVSATSKEPKIWITTLSEMAEWWKEKNTFKFKILKTDIANYEVEADCSENASILAKNIEVHCDTQDWFNGYKLIDARYFQLKSNFRPFIGVSKNCPESVIKLLKNDGYILEISDNKNDYAVYLDKSFDSTNERKIIETIENSGAPILRFWRWPDRAKSALCITGDIDALTLWDFVSRIWK